MSIANKFRDARTSFKSKTDEVMLKVDSYETAKAWKKYEERWKKICGGEIDEKNPYVRVERMLCNPKMLGILMEHDHLSREERRELAQKYVLPDVWELYLTLNDPIDPDHPPYTDIETKKLTREIKKAILHSSK